MISYQLTSLWPHSPILLWCHMRWPNSALLMWAQSVSLPLGISYPIIMNLQWLLPMISYQLTSQLTHSNIILWCHNSLNHWHHSYNPKWDQNIIYIWLNCDVCTVTSHWTCNDLQIRYHICWYHTDPTVTSFIKVVTWSLSCDLFVCLNLRRQLVILNSIIWTQGSWNNYISRKYL
jgi:hypothetical protein